MVFEGKRTWYGSFNHSIMLGRNLGGADRQMQIWSMER